jgi:hypothetical protein
MHTGENYLYYEFEINEMKINKKNKFGKTSMHSMIRMAQISDYGYNEIFPKILIREAENMKKMRKKKQINTKHTNTKQNNIKLKKGIQK